MDDLQRIERVYGSVNEYNRCRDEENARSFERNQNREKAYETAHQRVSEYVKDGYRGIEEAFCDNDKCLNCETRTQTFYQTEYDDIGVFFCLNKKCELIENDTNK